MKAVYLEEGAVNRGDITLEPITSVIETKVYKNTTEEDKLEYRTDGSDAFDTLCIGVELHMQDVTVSDLSGFCSYMGE